MNKKHKEQQETIVDEIDLENLDELSSDEISEVLQSKFKKDLKEIKQDYERKSKDQKDKIIKLQEEVLATKQSWQAEIHNLMKRHDKKVSDIRKYAIEKFATELLSVVDSFEHALAYEKKNNADEGFILIHKMLQDILKKFDIKKVATEGVFDPHYHEAITVLANNKLEKDHIIKVLQHGYLINDRLLRPAKVIVSKGKE